MSHFEQIIDIFDSIGGPCHDLGIKSTGLHPKALVFG